MDCKTFLNVGSFQRKMGGGGEQFWTHWRSCPLKSGCLPSIETAGVIIPGSTVTDDLVMQVSIAEFKTCGHIKVEYSTQ